MGLIQTYYLFDIIHIVQSRFERDEDQAKHQGQVLD